VTGSLHLRHAVWIGLAALVGVVVGYLVIADLGKSDPDDPVRTSQLDATATADGSGGVASQRVVVPDLLGERLPAAESELGDLGFRNYRELDATDQNRVIVEKDNWIVESQEPAAGQAVVRSTVIVLRLRKGTDNATPTPLGHGIVPNVICAELQAAQDVLRGSGFFVVTSSDATGQGRIAVMDRNWVVIAQSVKPGESPGLTTHITLSVVKHGEPAGSSGCET
jgi:hypothetical protein